MLTLLAHAGPILLLGDGGGKTHLLREISGELGARDLAEPITVPDIHQVRRGVSDVAVPVLHRVTYQQAGINIAVAFADHHWFVQR